MKHGASNGRLKREVPPVHDIAESDCREKAVDLAAKRRPEIVGQAFLAVSAAYNGIADAARHLQRLIDRQHDFGDADLLRIASQTVAAAWTAGALDKACLAQLEKELLQIVLADVLALRDGRERHRLGGTD